MTFNFAFWLSILLATNTCFGMWLAGKGKWEGWAMGLAGQPLWATYAIVTKGYGLLLTCVMFSYIYAKNLWKWRKQNHITMDQQTNIEVLYENAMKAMKEFREADGALPTSGEST